MKKNFNAKHASKIFSSCADELTDITKTANLISTIGGGLKNAVTGGWKSQGRFGQAMTGLQTATQLPEAVSDQDPTGQNRGKAERVAGLGGMIVGGLAGQHVGERMGLNVAKQIDPKDIYKAQAMRDITEAASARTVGPMSKPILRDVAQGVNKATLARMGTGARWANRGLRAIPFALGTGASLLGSMAGEKLLRKPFQWFGKQAPNPGVVGQYNNPETDQSVVTQSNNN